MFESEYALAVCLAKEYVRTQGTIRSVADIYNIPKSKVHRLLSEFITSAKGEDLKLALRVKRLIEKNKVERHFRGGKATRKLYLKKKKN